MSEKVRYLGVLVDQNLRFHEHVQSVVTTVSRRMYIVKNCVYLNSKPLANIVVGYTRVSVDFLKYLVLACTSNY